MPSPDILDPLRFLRFTMDSLPIGVLTVDAHRRVTSFNPQAQAVTGYTRDEALGRFCGEVLQGGMCKARCPLASVIRDRDPMVRLETTIQNRYGATIPVQMQTAALLDDHGELLGGVETFQDISYLKSLEEDKAHFISMVAHDMKSSLTIIGGFAHRLRKPSVRTDPEKLGQYLDILLDETEKLESMTGEFLEFSRLQTGGLKLSFQPMSLEEELKHLAASYQVQAEQLGIELDLRTEGGPDDLTADPDRLRRAFKNLLDNALKFSKPGGHVTISTQEAGEFVLVRFEDEGVGIDAEKLPHIFDPYFRAHLGTKASGFGVGLATVKAVVEGHGGHVEVKSEPGRGSVFTVHLPRVPAERSEA